MVIIINYMAARVKSRSSCSSKNEGDCVCLQQNSVAFMLSTTDAPVKCMLATMVALGYFSAALLLLSLSLPQWYYFHQTATQRFFACVSQVKATCFQLKWKQRQRKKINFWPISFKIQLPEVTFKPISIADRNVVRKAEFAFQNLPIWCHWYAKWLLTILIVLKICVHQDDAQNSKLCIKIQICA